MGRITQAPRPGLLRPYNLISNSILQRQDTRTIQFMYYVSPRVVSRLKQRRGQSDVVGDGGIGAGTVGAHSAEGADVGDSAAGRACARDSGRGWPCAGKRNDNCVNIQPPRT